MGLQRVKGPRALGGSRSAKRSLLQPPPAGAGWCHPPVKLHRSIEQCAPALERREVAEAWSMSMLFAWGIDAEEHGLLRTPASL